MQSGDSEPSNLAQMCKQRAASLHGRERHVCWLRKGCGVLRPGNWAWPMGSRAPLPEEDWTHVLLFMGHSLLGLLCSLSNSVCSYCSIQVQQTRKKQTKRGSLRNSRVGLQIAQVSISDSGQAWHPMWAPHLPWCALTTDPITTPVLSGRWRGEAS